LFSDDLHEEKSIRAEMLRQTGYLNAAEWCEHIRDHLELYRRYPNDFALDLQSFLESFKNDFLDRIDEGDRKLRQNCFEVIQVLLERTIENAVNVTETFKQLVPYVDRSLTTNKPIYEMGRAFNALDESLLEVKVYGNLFTFMLHVDGQYFPAIKTLCALKLAADGKKFTIENVENLTLEQMENLLGDYALPIFRIYDPIGRYLRNSIAHCNFTCNKGKLTCWDIDPRSKQIIWKKEITIPELSALINDLKSVENALIIWNVLRVLAEKSAKNIGYGGLQLKFKFAPSNYRGKNELTISFE
jgi:hypothetical protein